MKFILPKGSINVILPVFIQDSSSSTGAGLGSLDQTSSITGGFMKREDVGTALAVDENVTTEGTYQAPSTSAQVRIGTPANMITGVYELHFHNDLFNTPDWVTISLGGATNMAPLLIEVQLTNMDVNDGVRGGMTALPNTTPGAAGGVFIAGTNAATTITTSLTTTFTGNLTGSVGSLTGHTNQTADHTAAIADIPTVSELNARTLLAAGYFDPATDAVATVTSVGTVAGNVNGNVGGNVTGTVASVVGAVGSVAGNVDGNVTGTVASVVGAVGSVTGSVGSVTGAVGSVAGNVDGNVTGTVASVIGAVGSVTGATGSVTGAVGSVAGNVDGNVTGTVGGMATAMKAEVNAEVLDVMNVDTFGEPGQGTPPANTSIFAKINYLYKFLRNKKDNDGAVTRVYDDTGSVVDQKQTTAEAAGTVTKGEWISGP